MSQPTARPWKYEHGTSDQFHILSPSGLNIASTCDRLLFPDSAAASSFEEDEANVKFICDAVNNFNNLLDDDEPITEEFIASLGPTTRNAYFFATINTATRPIKVYSDGQVRLAVEGILLIEKANRGQVRHLIAALGPSTKEQP